MTAAGTLLFLGSHAAAPLHLAKTPVWTAALAAGGAVVLSGAVSRRLAVIAAPLLLGGLALAYLPATTREARPQARELFLQMDEASRQIDREDPSGKLLLWYGLTAPGGDAFDAIATSFQLCPRVVSTNFPGFHSPGVVCDGRVLEPGLTFAILSKDPGAFDLARRSLERSGLSARLIDSTFVPGPIENFQILVGVVVPGYFPDRSS
jgi:hypothetical protein